jgi:molybdate transport system substrate-binding protein
MRSKVFVVGLAALALAGCARSPQSSKQTRLTVMAASSLKNVFLEIGRAYTKEHPGTTFSFSFAGTDQLAAQIQQGAPADVFAGASTHYGDDLAKAGLIDPYNRFCTNRLVLVTPASNPAGIASLGDLASKPAKLVIGSEAVPVGAYTRKVLASLDAVFGSGYSTSVLSKVVSNEDSVSSILAKVQAGEADAGFVYVTDALAAGSAVRSIGLPEQGQAVATYPIAAVTAGKELASARRFVAFVLSPPAQELLRAAGFGPRPPNN